MNHKVNQSISAECNLVRFQKSDPKAGAPAAQSGAVLAARSRA
jgi:hypothetical protein